MLRATIPGLLLMLAFTPVLSGGPINGGTLEEIQVGDWKTTLRFRGGEKATVLVRATKDSSTARVKITVFDVNGAVVAEDVGKKPPTGNMAAVFWYPPRDAEYRIEVKNLDPTPGSCYVTIK